MEAISGSPNVIVVLTTQWRGQATGYAGDGNANTPFLDSLVESAVDCYQAVTPHPFGVFARAAFLTGVGCPDNGVRDYYDPLPRDTRTWAHRFGEAGYQSAFFGKWQLYDRDPHASVVGEAHARIEVPRDRRGGFEFWQGFESGFLLNDGFYHGDGIGAPVKIPGYQSDVLVDNAIDFMDTRSGDRPLFAVLSLDAPHPPYGEPASDVAPRPFESISLDLEVPPDPSIREIAQRELSGYYGHIEATDRSIGRLVRRIQESGEWENTIFAFTSVHGDMHGSGGYFRKGWPHEQSIRIPMLISWPRIFTEGRRDPLLVSLLDLGPTLGGLALDHSWGSSMGERRGADLSAALRLQAPGPERQWISMPSVPPFAKQCPYIWEGERTVGKTIGRKENGTVFSLDH